MKALLLDPSTKNIKKFMRVVDDYINDLSTIYRLLGCDTIDIVHRRVYRSKTDFVSFDVICDDNGLFKSDNLPALVLDWKDHTPDVEYIVGKVLLCGPADAEGYQTDLDPEVVLALFRFVCMGKDTKTFCLRFPASDTCFV